MSYGYFDFSASSASRPDRDALAYPLMDRDGCSGIGDVGCTRGDIPLRVRAHRIARWRRPHGAGTRRRCAGEAGHVGGLRDVQFDQLDRYGVVAYRLGDGDVVIG